MHTSAMLSTHGAGQPVNSPGGADQVMDPSRASMLTSCAVWEDGSTRLYVTTWEPNTARLGATPGVTADGEAVTSHTVWPVWGSSPTSESPPGVATYTTKRPPAMTGCERGDRSLRAHPVAGGPGHLVGDRPGNSFTFAYGRAR